MVTASAVTSPTGTSKTLQKLSLLKIPFEDETSMTQGEVQKIEKLEQEAAELDARARDLRVQVQEQRFIISQLDLETTSTSQQIKVLEEEIQVEQAKHQGQMLVDFEAARLGLVGLL
ncbi:hypothetical protein LIER_16234 [Lithospermum erythrorhizon]|uniref:Uncharacterized protein n=1 Tax=Lithospermum erythrorhizon TaxID=34254 RepID=A0AAV3Q8G1_LITER